jgi:tellurite resistance protein
MKKIYEDTSILQIQILALIAWADGQVTVEETEFLNNAIQGSPCSRIKKNELLMFIEKIPPLETVLQSLDSVPKEVAITILRNAYALASADGTVGKMELEMIDSIALKLGIDENKINLFHEWLKLSFQCDVIEIKLFKIKSYK